MYHEDDNIQLSSLQHYLFCPRQCGLIHVDGLWAENMFTARGRVMHRRVDSGADETRGGTCVTRSLNIYSREYGLSGKADVVEFRNEHGTAVPYPVEYKSGKPKLNSSDTVQLCAQALCLEEMLGVAVPEAALFYGKTRRRLIVALSEELRSVAVRTIMAVHEMIEKRTVPPAKYGKKCRSCSMYDQCMPSMTDRKTSNYIKELYRYDEAAP